MNSQFDTLDRACTPDEPQERGVQGRLLKSTANAMSGLGLKDRPGGQERVMTRRGASGRPSRSNWARMVPGEAWVCSSGSLPWLSREGARVAGPATSARMALCPTCVQKLGKGKGRGKARGVKRMQLDQGRQVRLGRRVWRRGHGPGCGWRGVPALPLSIERGGGSTPGRHTTSHLAPLTSEAHCRQAEVARVRVGMADRAYSGDGHGQ